MTGFPLNDSLNCRFQMEICASGRSEDYKTPFTFPHASTRVWHMLAVVTHRHE